MAAANSPMNMLIKMNSQNIIIRALLKPFGNHSNCKNQQNVCHLLHPYYWFRLSSIKWNVMMSDPCLSRNAYTWLHKSNSTCTVMTSSNWWPLFVMSFTYWFPILSFNDKMHINCLYCLHLTTDFFLIFHLKIRMKFHHSLWAKKIIERERERERKCLRVAWPQFRRQCALATQHSQVHWMFLMDTINDGRPC